MCSMVREQMYQGFELDEKNDYADGVCRRATIQTMADVDWLMYTVSDDTTMIPRNG
jgi:hypothetical protein